MSAPGTTPGSTLVEELETAAYELKLAAEVAYDGVAYMETVAFSARLLERAALVRELERSAKDDASLAGPLRIEITRAFTGPIAAR
jgi:hypothetical protein